MVTPKPKGWSTAKLKASTLKRLQRIRESFSGGDDPIISVDATVNLLIDRYYDSR
ncbi:hypothetical protein R6Y95_06185 [Methanoculleus palmolei]|uniref:Uncharacterized protein n=1 Tax=Methanoculleus palmolei TaxID=72612 RepID=A0ABD8A8Y5_9EURY|nr:hypothetical protein R6Y95_06185 [Methanoculleus palmolei]